MTDVATLEAKIISLEHENAKLLARLYPCKGCTFRRATHAKKDVIFGVVNAELCESCAAERAEQSGETWVVKEEATVPADEAAKEFARGARAVIKGIIDEMRNEGIGDEEMTAAMFAKICKKLNVR